jgi:hypothetical protein
MSKFVQGASMALAISLAFGSVANATLTADELKGQTGVSKAASKFTAAKAKCISKCLATQFKLPVPNFASCLNPYTDPAVSFCILDSIKGAEAKFTAAAVKAGLKDCPECYDSGNCASAAATRTATIESQIDPFGGIVACDPAPTADIFKCETAVSKILSKYVGARNKCYDKCFAAAFKNNTPAAACTPPATDPTVVACLSDSIKGTEAKAAASIDKACFIPGTAPACYAGGGLGTGAAWATLVGVAIDGNVGNTYCGSASGAFIE